MANLQKHRAHESLNVDTAAVWDVQTRIQIDASGGLSAGVSGDLSSYNQVCIEADVEVYFRFVGTIRSGGEVKEINQIFPTSPENVILWMVREMSSHS